MCNGSSSGSGGGSGGGSPGINSKASQKIRDKLGITSERFTPREIRQNIKNGKITRSDYEKGREMAKDRVNNLKDMRREIYNKTNYNPYENGTKTEYQNYKEAKREITNLKRIP